MPGYQELHIYPPVSDLARAKQLAHGHHGTAILYTCNRHPLPRASGHHHCKPESDRHQRRRQDVSWLRLRQPSRERGARFDIVLDAWISDYFDPFDSLNALLDGKTITPVGNNNVSYFNDPVYNRRFDAAAKLTGAARYRAYARLDADLTRDAAPWVPVSNSLIQAFFSARVGCQQFAPAAASNIDLAALCIRAHAH